MRMSRFTAPFLAILLVSCSVEIQHGLDENEANQIAVVLQAHGIAAKKERETGGKDATWKILTSSGKEGIAWKILRDNELPRMKEKGISDIFGKGSLIPTATEEKAMFLAAIQGEVQRTLLSMDGVIDARVHVVLPDDSMSARSDPQSARRPSASVFVKRRARLDKMPQQPSIDEIRRLVAGAIEGLTPDRVIVVSSEITPKSLEHEGELTPILGIAVAQTSATAFRLLIAFLAITVLGAVVLVFFLATQRRGLRERVEEITAELEFANKQRARPASSAAAKATGRSA